MKKHKQIELFWVLTLLFITCVWKLINAKKVQVPIPDKIIVYFDNKEIEIRKNDDYFDELSKLNAIYNSDNLLEMSIDSDTISEIKKGNAIEYIMDSEKNIKIGEKNKSYTKLLFPYSGWCKNTVIFFDGEKYCSGTIKNYVSDKKFLFYIKRISMDLDGSKLHAEF